MPGRDPIFIAGPTGAGKSAVALRLAQLIQGEIVSVDSMQVYRGLDIGTGKPTPAERAKVPHHLVDVVGLEERFDAAQFVRLARRAVEQIESRGHTPIFCGGTGFYFKAYLEGIGEAPPGDAALRAELESLPLPRLLAELELADPVLFTEMDRENRRRVVRAVEVIRLTGRPFSRQRAGWSGTRQTGLSHGAAPIALSGFLFGLQRVPEDLRERIDRRVEAMFEHGLVVESERLLARGLEHNRTAMQAIGYRQVVEHLRGERSLPETVALVKQRTRQFAKRQMTWFRHQLPLRWLELPAGTAAEDIARKITEMLAS